MQLTQKFNRKLESLSILALSLSLASPSAFAALKTYSTVDQGSEATVESKSTSDVIATKRSLGVHLGAAFPKASVSSDVLDKQTIEEYDNTLGTNTGATVGLRANFPLTSFIVVQPEVSYVKKGYTATVDEEANLQYRTDLHYVQVSPLLKAQLPLERVSPYIIGGPSVGILASANESFESRKASSTREITRDKIESLEFCLTAGGGATFNATEKMGFFIEGRYQRGLTNLLKGADSSMLSLNTQVVQFTGGVLFEI